MGSGRGAKSRLISSERRPASAVELLGATGDGVLQACRPDGGGDRDGADVGVAGEFSDRGDIGPEIGKVTAEGVAQDTRRAAIFRSSAAWALRATMRAMSRVVSCFGWPVRGGERSTWSVGRTKFRVREDSSAGLPLRAKWGSRTETPAWATNGAVWLTFALELGPT